MFWLISHILDYSVLFNNAILTDKHNPKSQVAMETEDTVNIGHF